MPARSDARIRTPPLAHDSNSSSDEGRARAGLFQVAASGNSPESVPGQGQITSAWPAWYCTSGISPSVPCTDLYSGRADRAPDFPLGRRGLLPMLLDEWILDRHTSESTTVLEAR